MRAAAVAVATVVVLSACGGDGDSVRVADPGSAPASEEAVSGDQPSTGADGAAPAAVQDAPEPEPDSGGSDSEGGSMVASAEASTGEIAFISDVRSAGHDGYDRVVFEYESSAPGYEVGWVEAPIVVDPSDKETVVAGSHFLEVRMSPSSSVDLDRPGPKGYRESYTGPRRVLSDTTNVTEVVEGTDFEAQAIWIIGMDRAADDVEVSVLRGPSRLVIDVS